MYISLNSQQAIRSVLALLPRKEALQYISYWKNVHGNSLHNLISTVNLKAPHDPVFKPCSSVTFYHPLLTNELIAQCGKLHLQNVHKYDMEPKCLKIRFPFIVVIFINNALSWKYPQNATHSRTYSWNEYLDTEIFKGVIWRIWPKFKDNSKNIKGSMSISYTSSKTENCCCMPTVFDSTVEKQYFMSWHFVSLYCSLMILTNYGGYQTTATCPYKVVLRDSIGRG